MVTTKSSELLMLKAVTQPNRQERFNVVGYRAVLHANQHAASQVPLASADYYSQGTPPRQAR
jgi:hypothetical protein